MSRHAGILTLSFSSIAHTYSHLFTLLYATVVLVLEREWGLGYDTLFALSIPMSVLFGAAALPAGWLGDRWSASGMMALFFLGVGGCSIWAGLANSPLTICLALAGIGLFAAIYHPVGIPWLVRNAVNRGRALGVNGVFGSAGTAGAALVAGLLADLYGWRAAFIIPGAVCLVTGIAFVWARQAGLLLDRKEDLVPQPAPAKGDLWRVFWVMSATMLCTGLLYQATAFALPKIFDERLSDFFNGSMLGVGGMVTFVYTCSALSQLVGGELADRFSLRKVYIAVQWLQIPVILFGMVLIHPALVGVAALMVSLNVAGQPAENSLLAKYTPPQWRGRAFGAKFVLTLGVSSLGVAVIPVIYRLTGTLDVLFLLLAGAAACAGIFAIMLPRDDRAASRPVAQAAAAE
ncbi:MAG TPA: MFS transporter [Ferrovibrio sp.]|jgi:FSR family fosmidomycin resistance protein-like MFS transporter|uniref:MFS transporter n=1 Tax=Ferrovibrio sp. TaxID=1917215 RepID=UPI002B4B5E28|nr:MFS transporter [Ferrovibrio sp.]HLT75798.1 MFS transporter [Ferrovibrio sp.]